jgi:hypothetical protein
MFRWNILKATYLSDYKVKFIFADHSVKLFDFEPYLNTDAFEELKDKNKFKEFNLANHTITWLNGDVDFAPETIYIDGITLKGEKISESNIDRILNQTI